MAERKYKSANIATQTDTFGAWVDRTNQIVFDLSETVVTAQQNTVGGSTSGNVVITSNVYNQDTQAWVNSTGGILQSNTIAVYNDLRGVVMYKYLIHCMLHLIVIYQTVLLILHLMLLLIRLQLKDHLSNYKQ